VIGSNFAAAGVGKTYAAPRITAGGVAGGGSSASTSPLSYLTADDRDLIARATGVVIGPDGRNQHGNGTAPILALEIAHDRKTGRLPAGQPITSTYLTSRFHTAGGDVDFAASVNAMLQEIGTRAGEERLDLRA
jgi:hypothetical protein